MLGDAVNHNAEAVLAPALIGRRSFLAGAACSVAAASLLGGCAGGLGLGRVDTSIYGPVPDEPYPIPAADISQVDPIYLRRTVNYTGDEPPGTIVVDLKTHHLYHVMEDGTAVRYGVNGPREAFEWSGEAFIERKAHWPIWTPTPGQISRDPSLVEWRGGMPPGLNNPLGSRALYLYQNGVYTLATIYGTSDPSSLGRGVSSACIGLLNQDIIHLYERVPLGTRVVILPA
ncbi:MAG: L,D-transpeptidase [Bauldia sp.]|nr:L,D-transpeptidase [Bauldia sp.]